MTKTNEKLIANQTSHANKITEGKSYKVLNKEGAYCEIIDDENEKRWVYISRFDSPLLSSAKAIANDADKLAERLRVRDEVAAAIRNESLPGGMLFDAMRGNGSGWRILDGIVSIQSNNFKINEASDPNVEVLEKLREILRVPEGENILTHAKVVRTLADALIGLQK